MNKQEAQKILTEKIAKYRKLSYDELKKIMNNPVASEITAPSGVWYQLEIQAFWDDKSNGDIRVMAAIDDGGLRAFIPLTECFIKDSLNNFINE